MKIDMLAPSAVKPYPNNPRRNKSAVADVRKSIEQFGFRQPVVVDKKMVLVVGHTRWQAALEMGLKTIPVHIAKDLTDAQARAYRIADNKTGEKAEWDNPKLVAEFAALADDFPDLTTLGFSSAEIAAFGEEKVSKRDLANFETMPLESQQWILVRAPESECARILAALKKLKPEGRIEYSGEKK